MIVKPISQEAIVMTKKEGKKYFEKQWTEMKSGLKSFLKEENQEDLHRFRVQVKKLRAFLILLDSAADNSKILGNFKPVRKVFKSAGEIRNAFMNQKLTKIMNIDRGEFINDQLQLQLKSTKKFKSSKIRFIKDLKDTHGVLEKKIKAVDNLHISLFYQNQLNKIATILAKPKFGEQLHECRKLVKILMYNYKPAHAALGSSLNDEYLDQVQTAIGDWHDHILTLDLLSGTEFMINNSTFQREGRKLRKNIISLTKDFYNQATTVVEVPLEQVS